MPKHDSIIIHPAEMTKIMEALKAKQHFAAVKIVDVNEVLMIRDLNEAKIAEVKKIRR